MHGRPSRNADMAESGSLDGPALGGFNADISLTRPSHVPARRLTGRSIARSLSQNGVPEPSQASENATAQASEDEGARTPAESEAELMAKATSRVSGIRMR